METPSAESDDRSVSGTAACVEEKEIIVVKEEEIINVEDLAEEAKGFCDEPPIPIGAEDENQGDVGFEVEEGECGFGFEADEAEHENEHVEKHIVADTVEQDMVDYEELLIEAFITK